MAQQTPHSNPFMLMVNPEVVFAAMEASERLSQLNRHLCRPLDRVAPAGAEAPSATMVEDDEDEVELPPED
jgi:hypothetical protein